MKKKHNISIIDPRLQRPLVITDLGTQPYEPTLNAMQAFARTRKLDQADCVWILEHPSIYTQGALSKSKDIISTLPHPLCDTDRGGQITYHGPGQIIGYFMIQLTSTRSLIPLLEVIEQVLIETLFELGISADRDQKSRGIYVNNKKIASIGLRVKNHSSYHGFALNCDMDLSPFTHINPCGRPQIMTQIKDHQQCSVETVKQMCIKNLARIWKTRDICHQL